MVLAGCGNEKEPPPEDTMTLKEQFERAVSEGVVKNVAFAEWLTAMTREYESREQNIFEKVFIFRGEWKKRMVYFRHNKYDSTLFFNVFYEDGERIRWTEDAPLKDFKSTSKNWQLIFEWGYGEYDFIIFSL